MSISIQVKNSDCGKKIQEFPWRGVPPFKWFFLAGNTWFFFLHDQITPIDMQYPDQM